MRHNRRRTPLAGFQTLLSLGTVQQPTAYHEITHKAETAPRSKADKHDRRHWGD